MFARNNRIKPEHLEVWLSNDGENWSHDESVTWENDSEGWKVIFSEGTESRYVKLHSLWDERDEDYLPVDKATYSGNSWNLFEVSYIADGKENNYIYDARGNRLNEIEAYTGSNGRLTAYEYYANSDLIKRAGNWYFNYDRNGNLVARGTSAQVSGNELFSAWTFSETEGELWTYEYDLQNRMVKANYSGAGTSKLTERASYVYDYRGLLIKKTYQNYTPSDLVEVANKETSKPVTEFYEYTADGHVIYNERSEENDTNQTTYIWANTTLWCEINGGVVYYHHTDHLGTTEVVTNENGTVVWEAGYEAFGSVLNERGESKFTPSYTGKFFDKASDLYYFNARWYDSNLGRFTTQDPARDGINWWNYCNGNPMIYTDPDGHFIFPLLSIQKQNQGSNKYAQIGKYLTYDKKGRTNVLGTFGCLFVVTVNIGNTINKYNDSSYTDKQASEYSTNDSYFDFGKESAFRFYNFACDFGSSNSHMEQLLFDMTGKNCSIQSVWGEDISSTLNLTRSYVSKGAYLIGKVKTPNDSFHYINITGFDENGNMQWEDPYSYEQAAPQYSQSDILELKVIKVEE